MSKMNTGVPDALDPTTAPGNRNYTSEHLEYVYGWNDCRQAMLEQPAPVQEPWAWLFQHEETGLTQCVDTQQVEWGFEKNNPRWQKIAPLYTTPQAQSKPLTLQELEAAWNAQADHMNTWNELGLDEIVAWAQAAHNIREKS